MVVTGSPVTNSGTLGLSLASAAANYVFAAPNGSSGAPVFRALAAADLPVINLASSSAGGVTGNLPVANRAGGSGAPSTTFWRGDGSWAIPPGSSGAVPCSDMPALTGAVTSTAGSCATTLSPSTLETQFIELQFPSATSTAIASGTYDFMLAAPWAGCTGSTCKVLSVTYVTGGTSPSFGLAVQIGGTAVTGCTGITVTSATVTSSTCSAANTFTTGANITAVITATSGTIVNPRHCCPVR